LVPSIRKALVLTALAGALAALALPAKKKKEEETQTLQSPRELPAAVAGETRRLSFYVTPLSAKGLLSQQVRDALKNLERQAAGNPVLHIRAFVAGSGDLRRVRDLVSETFTERRLALPSLSLVQAGALPLPGAQVELEAVINGRKDLYPGGLAFFPAQAAVSPDLVASVAPLFDKTLAGLRASVRAVGLAPSDVLRVTCFFSSLDNFVTFRDRVRSEYPRAALDSIVTERTPQRAVAACEATAGLTMATRRLAFQNPPEEAVEVDDASRIALVGAPHVVFTGSQVSFGYEERDTRLAFDRLAKTLEPLGTSLRDVAFAHMYPLSLRIEEQVRRDLPALFERDDAPAASLLEFEGLSSADASFAVDVVAAKD
jgi:enamine deaminase RidA (YjgF/YER057c/UK114 family)